MSEPTAPIEDAVEAKRVGWSAAKPDVIPRATPWPAAMAFGITLFAWGFVTSPLILGVGVLIFAISLAGWIGEMRHER